MILVDVNVLVFSHRRDLSSHQQALGWLTKALSGEETVAVWDEVMTSAYRILTNPKLFKGQNLAPHALKFLNEVRDASVVIHPGDRFWEIFMHLVAHTKATGNMVTDAAIAAVAKEQGCRLATFDRDFARFPGLDYFHP